MAWAGMALGVLCRPRGPCVDGGGGRWCKGQGALWVLGKERMWERSGVPWCWFEHPLPDAGCRLPGACRGPPSPPPLAVAD